MIKYKIRKEKDGAYLFNKSIGKVNFLSENIFQLIKDIINCQIIYPKISLKNLPNDCFAAPSKVYVELTRKCTLRCKTCYNSAGKALVDELSKEKIFCILDELAKAGTFEIRFTGGEPTARKDFFEIVDYAYKLGFFISIGTNGIWNKDLLEKIAKAPIDMVIISIEGSEKINDYIRGKNMLKKAINSLDYLSKNTNKALRINTTIAKYNVKHIDFVVELADKYNIPVLNTMPIRLSGRSVMFLKDQLLSPEEYYDFIKHVEELRKSCKVNIQTYFDILGVKNRWLENQTSLVNKRSCAAGVEACVIAPSGDVYGCAASNPRALTKEARERFVAGNVNENSIMDIWLDSPRWNLYRDYKQNKSENCLKCKFYMNKCFGNCFVSSFFDSGKLCSKDPYCFAHLLDKQVGGGKNV